MRFVLLAALLGATAVGCAGISEERGHDQVAKLVRDRTGYATHGEHGPPSDGRIAKWVDDLLRGGLTVDHAVEIALLNNPSLRITYEELNVSQADMVQAGLLPNPAIGGSFGVPLSNHGDREYEASISEDFLGIFVLPLRKRVAREQFEADVLRVSHETMRVAADVKKAMVSFQAQTRMVELRRSVVEAAEVSAELSRRQRQAGNIEDLAFTREQTTYEQARLDLMREELMEVEAREELNRLLGLWGPRTAWSLAGGLAELPAADPPLERIESRAIARRLDVDAARKQADLMWTALELARDSRLFGVVDVGAHMHQDSDGPRLIGPTLSLELPIFDQRQALIGRLEAQYRQALRRLDAIAIDARADVRLARARLIAARETVEHYRRTVMPLRDAAVEQAQLQYNGMQIGLYELLGTKQAQIESYRGYLDAIRDYWIASADLDLAVGGRAQPRRDAR
jgi:cobalt-zinc-cadmium efflux system outer membrane protein